MVAIKKYVHAMENLDNSLNGEFINSGSKLLFSVIFAFASSYSFVIFETFNRGQCFIIFSSG